MITIYQTASKLIKNITLTAGVLALITTAAMAAESYQMGNPTSEKVNLQLAISRHEHSRGLSGTKPSEFPNDKGMLFVNDQMGRRTFWMPDTYFNLDIIFLDTNLKIVGIEKNVPFHPGNTEPPVIYRTKVYQAMYVLETKAGVPFSKSLKVGDQLKWISSISLSEIALRTRQKQ